MTLDQGAFRLARSPAFPQSAIFSGCQHFSSFAYGESSSRRIPGRASTGSIDLACGSRPQVSISSTHLLKATTHFTRRSIQDFAL